MAIFFQDESRGLIINDSGVTCGRKFYAKHRILEWKWESGYYGSFISSISKVQKGRLCIIVRNFNPFDFFKEIVEIDRFSMTEVVGDFQGHVNEIKWEQAHKHVINHEQEIKCAENEQMAAKFKDYFDREHHRYVDLKAALNLMLASK